MARQRRRELFPPDRGLQARMLVAMVATPIVGIAAIVLGFLLLHRFQHWLFVALVVLGAVACVRELRRHPSDEWLLAADREPELWAIVDRLCVTADLPRPEVVLHQDREPNSWVVDLPRKPARLHVTRGLLDLLEPAELEAVIAHELAHLVHRDAMVMTVVGLPGDALSKNGFGGGAGAFAVVAGAITRIGSASLSRHRELTADAGSGALTGRPSALASALLKVSGALRAIPDKDLRAVGRPSLNLMPCKPGRLERWSPWRTHPSVETRVAALERMERRLATARPGAPRD